MINLRILLLDIVKPLNFADGALIHRYELINNLAQLNHKISVISMNNLNHSLNPTIKNYNININSNKLFIHFNYILIFIYLMSFKKFDVIYTRNPNLCFIASLFSKICKNKILIYELNGIPEDESEIVQETLKTNDRLSIPKAKKLIFKSALKHSNKIIAVTPGIKEYIHSKYGIHDEKIVVINNGANTDLFRPVDQNEAKIKLKLDPSKIYICFVGNFAPWQGVEYLIQAAPAILEVCQNVHFLIVGDGDMREKWVQLTNDLGISEQFIFTGKVPYESIYLFINASDICVAPFVIARNAKIGLSPLKIYEYFSCAKPVVASNISGVSDLLHNSGGGIVVTPENPQALAEVIIELVRNEDIRREMGSNGRKYAVENNSWANVAKKTSEVYESLIAH